MSDALTYPLFALGICLITGFASRITGSHSLRKPGLWKSAVILIVLTILFDNAIVGFGIVTYDTSQISGIRLGYMPIEDLSYALVAPFLVDTISQTIRRYA